jgi:histidinol-phosphate phosphatase family protein
VIRQAIILAGGKGTRLASRLNGLPKPLVDVLGAPLLERQVLALKAAGFDRILLLVNHEAQQIADFCAARDNWGVSIAIIDDGEPRGTAGATLAAWDDLEAEFCVVYGDTLFDIDFARFIAFHGADPAAAATLFLHPNDHPHDSDLVEVADDGAITAFHPYPHPADAWLPNMVNAALYLVRRAALADWRPTADEGVTDFAKDLFPRMTARGARLRGYVSPEYIKDVGTPSRIDEACAALESGRVARSSLREPQAAVFLDRDGTLNAHNGYVRSPDDLRILPGAGEAVRRLNRAGLRTALVTNQPILARGECDAAGLALIHAKLETELGRQGAFLDRIYHCPHHPDAGFPGEVAALKIACDCRKPGPGLLLRGAADLNVDLAKSWMIGDSLADVRAARACGVTAILVRTGDDAVDPAQAEASSDFIVADVGAAARLILDVYPCAAAEAAPLAHGLAAGADFFIAGQSRSGKSTLAGVITRELRLADRPALHISLDRWLKPQGEVGDGLLGRFDLDAATDAFAQAATRHDGPVEIELPVFSLRARERQAPMRVALTPGTVIVWEGVIALALAERLGRLADSLYVEADEAVRRTRVIAEYLRRGRTPEAAAQVYDSRLDDEIRPLDEARDRAARVLSGDSLFETAP